MIRLYVFNSQVPEHELDWKRRLQAVADARADGHPVKGDDHAGMDWYWIDFETDEEAVEFKLKYL